MRLLKEGAQVAPSTFFATLLNAPCSSLLLTNATEQSTVYLVVGKSNGETVFFPTDRSECISKYECDLPVPITALVAGDLRNIGRKEVVTITSNGLLQSLNYPSSSMASGGVDDTPCPTLAFCQQIYANVCFADILDIDGDGRAEFLVAMTDRVVRSYRFSSETDHLIPLNKWEMPSHISSCCVGGLREKYALLSQCDRNQYIQLEFGDLAKPAQLAVQLKTLSDITSTVTGSGSGDGSNLSLEDGGEISTRLVVTSRPHSTLMFHCLAERIVLINKEQNKETELRYSGGGIICATTVVLSSGLALLVAVDAWGQMQIYGWQESADEIKWLDPIAKCQVSRDVDYICGFAGLQEFSVIISTVNIYNKIAIFSIDLSHIIATT